MGVGGGEWRSVGNFCWLVGGEWGSVGVGRVGVGGGECDQWDEWVWAHGLVKARFKLLIVVLLCFTARS